MCGCDRDCDCPYHPADSHHRDCDCLLDPNDKCPHVAQADNPAPFEVLQELYPPDDPDEGVLASWRRFLHEEVGGEYFEIEARPEVAICIDRAARVALLRQRVRRGEHLWNRQDVLEDMALAQQCVKVSGGTGRRTAEVRHA